ncbi:MAG: hypothetical protein HFI90_09580 [Clostridia bacterium]|nr:hypothetical protein [Clostridia bacterium]
MSVFTGLVHLSSGCLEGYGTDNPGAFQSTRRFGAATDIDKMKIEEQF